MPGAASTLTRHPGSAKAMKETGRVTRAALALRSPPSHASSNTAVDVQMRHRQFTAILEHSPQATIILDAHGCIQVWNSAAETMFGWRRSEILGGLLLQLVPPDGIDDFEQAWATLIAGGTPPQYDAIRLHRDGRRIPVSVHITPIQSEAGDFAGAVSTLSPWRLAHRRTGRACSRMPLVTWSAMT